MAQTNPYIAGYLQQFIYYSLDNNLVPSALFLATRLHAHDPRSPDASYLLSLCHLRLNQVSLAIEYCGHVATDGKHLGCSYVFAQCCLQLGRFTDGINALERGRPLWEDTSNWNKHSQTQRQASPDEPAVLFLLGRLHDGCGDTQKAVDCYARASKQNPFLWDAFIGLCDAGAAVQAENIFEATPEMIAAIVGSSDSSISSRADPFSSREAVTLGPVKSCLRDDPFRISTRHNIQGDSEELTALHNSKRTPGSEMMAGRPQKPSKATKSSRRALDAEINGTQGVGRKRTLSSQTRDAQEAIGSRRSTRLMDRFLTAGRPLSSGSGVAEGGGRDIKRLKAGVSQRTGQTSSGRSHEINEDSNLPSKAMRIPAIEPAVKIPRSGCSEAQSRREGVQWLLNLLKKLGGGYALLAQLRCRAALDMFFSVPSAHRDTIWVLSKMARAYSEQADYAKASEMFSRARAIAPTSVEDMDIYSTTLWHLKNEADLAFLSHELIDLDRLSPQTWCAVGNSFSLQRDHGNAIKCFRRATQLDPKFAYGFTLQGHEHAQTEEYDEAIRAYQSSIAAQRRHYNSWYGLGRVYQKLGQYDRAERYFHIALKLNPENAILLGCIGMVLEKKNQPESAMMYYNKACATSQDSIFARGRRASLLLQQKDIEGALTELRILKGLTPGRADVHILLGRLYGRRSEKGTALQCYTTALGLNPLASALIKEEVEALEEGEDE